MSCVDFLTAFAHECGKSSFEDLMAENSRKYDFLLNIDDNAVAAAHELRPFLPQRMQGLRALHIGCQYGAVPVALGAMGMKVVGTEATDAKLRLANIYAGNNEGIKFVKCFATSLGHLEKLADDGPYSLIIVHGLFERYYDTIRLLRDLKSLAQPDAVFNFKIDNGFSAVRIKQDPIKRRFGLALLRPDKIGEILHSEYLYFPRSLKYYTSMFRAFDLKVLASLGQPSNLTLEQARSRVEIELRRIRKLLEDLPQTDPSYAAVGMAVRQYLRDAMQDLKELDADELDQAYLCPHWNLLVS